MAGEMPAGTRLEVKRFGITGGRLEDPETGEIYRLWGTPPFVGLCPLGRCVPAGATGVLALPLVLANAVERGEIRTYGFAEGLDRIPHWMERIGRLEKGSTVRVVDWRPCDWRRARIEPPPGSPGSIASPIIIEVAPPGLLLPPS